MNASADFYYTLTLLLMGYCAVVRTAVQVVVTRVYDESHPAQFMNFLKQSTIVAAVGIGMTLCLGTLVA